ncbi:MAG: beta-galactosidase [Armatimonadetes bacterium]|nr:beta-galactosidase [Armatimonadota bacterium]
MHMRRWWGLVCLCLMGPGLALAQEVVPLDLSGSQWIWAPPGGPEPTGLAFRKTFNLVAMPAFAQVVVTGSESYDLSLNGEGIGSDGEWTSPDRYDITAKLQVGANVLAVMVKAGPPRGGLLVALRAVDDKAGVLDVVSDDTWRLSASPGAGWTAVGFDDQAWSPAGVVGPYGCLPWGRLTRLSIKETHRALDDLPLHPPAEGTGKSAFSGAYTRPELAAAYGAYYTVEHGSGRFRLGDSTAPLLFVRYSQAGANPAGAVTRPAQFDLGLFEADLEAMARHHLQVALEGFSWVDLLDGTGAWRRLDEQPTGGSAPHFDYVYQLLDRLLDRVQAHGLHALALLDYRRPLPADCIAAPYVDKALLSPPVWTTILAGQAKIAGHFAERPVLVGYALAGDALPAWPVRTEPLLLEAFHGWLAERHGDIAGLRRDWGSNADYASLDQVPVPGAAGSDPAAVDFHALQQKLVIERVNEWAAAMREADPHHLLIYGDPGEDRPLLAAQQLHVDLLGPFALDPVRDDPAPLEVFPGYSQALAGLRPYAGLADGGPLGLLGGRLGAGSRGAAGARLVRHEWLQVVGHGGAGLLAAPSWHRLANRAPGIGPADETTLGLLGELVAATSLPLLARQPAVLVLRNDAVALSNRPELDGRAVRRVGESLDRLHVAYAIAPASLVGAAAEPGKVDLDKYRAVVLPCLDQLPEPAVWARLKQWFDDAEGEGRRLVVLGLPGRLDEYFQTSSRPEALSSLLGEIEPQTAVEAPESAFLFLPPPLAPLPTGRRIPWSPGDISPLGLGERHETAPLAFLRTPADERVGREGRIVLARRTAHQNQVVVAGFALGRGDLDSFGAAQQGSLTTLLGGVFDQAEVQPAVEAPENLSVFLAEGGRAAFVAERFGSSADTAWTTVATQPQVAWSNSTTRFDGKGRVTVATPLAPYQVLALLPVADIFGVDPGQTAMVRAGQAGVQPIALTAQGPASLRLRLWLDPGQVYSVQAGSVPLGLIPSGPDGSLDVAVPKGGPATIKVASVPFGDPGKITAEQVLVVGDWYGSRGEWGRALREYDRLQTLYPGTDVAKLAGERRNAVLTKSAAVVVVNCSVIPLALSYAGPTHTEGVVGPGKQKTFLLYAGDYVETRAPGDNGESLPGLSGTDRFTVQARQVVVREYGALKPNGSTDWDMDLNARGKLTDEERKALTAEATAALPAPPGAAAAGAPAAAGGPAPKGPEIPVQTLLKYSDKENAKQTRISVLNDTDYVIELNIIQDFGPGGGKPKGKFMELKPHGRGSMTMVNSGSWAAFGKVLPGGQEYTFGLNRVIGKDVNCTLHQMTPREVEAQERGEERRERPRPQPRPRGGGMQMPSLGGTGR